MQTKTNAIRILEQHQIAHEIRTYEVDENDLSAEHVAENLGVPPETIYKTLVLKGQTDAYLVVLLPANAHLDLKKIAKISGNKNCEMLSVKDLLQVTGYIRGGCSPIGMKKQFPTYIEELATLESTITISAGKRGVQIVLNPIDLQALIQAKFADLIL